MNLIEAIKSGKKFKRKSQPNKGYWYQAGNGLTFYEDDILADDWEIESHSVTITREQFDAAWLEAIQKAGGNLTYGYFECFSKLVAKELGL